ncbi:MAG: hypothetical protein FJ184_00010 [Gammaproteobacteria bacterium]|nr:hypothetical protein [Gammaproteobacteria bacterium]
MVTRKPIVLISGASSELPPGDLVPGIDTTAQASGNAALVAAANALASGNLGIANAAVAQASGNAALVVGASALASGNLGIAGAATALASGNAALVVGAGALASGNAALTNAATALASGNAALVVGSRALASGTAALASGNAALLAAANALASGNLGIANAASAQSTANSANLVASTALASGNAALVVGSTALASGNAALVVGSTALASGNAALAGLTGKYDKTGGPISGPAFTQSQTFGVPSGTILGSGVIILNLGARDNFEIVLTAGTSTLARPTNASGGQCGAIIVRQDSAGTRLLTYSGSWSFASNTAPTLTTTASGIDMFGYYVVNSNRINVVSNLNFGSGTVS